MPRKQSDSGDNKGHDACNRLQNQDENLGIGLLVLDSENRILNCNRQIEELFGYTFNEIDDQPIELLFPEIGTELSKRNRSKQKKQDESKPKIICARHKNGSAIQVELSLNHFELDGKKLNIATIANNEQRINFDGDRARLAAIVDSSEDAILSKNLDGIVQSWNLAAQNLFGYTAEEMIGKSVKVLVPSNRSNEEPEILKQIARGERIHHYETVRQRKDGSEFFVSLTISPIKDFQGRIVGASKIVRDITDRKLAEAELVKAKEELEQRVLERTKELTVLNRELQKAKDKALQSSQFKSEFLTNMSHEIRTPMNGILGMTEVLLKSGLNSTQLGYANTVYEAGRSLLAVINDVLDFAKIEAGKLTLETAEFDPVKLVESVAELLVAQAKKKNLTLLTFIDPQIPRSLLGDPGRLRQVLVNFTGNAIKFSEQGEIIIRAQLENNANSELKIKFSVTDRGIGMSDFEMEHLFQPFVQIDGELSSKLEGTGLGLSISKRLVDMMEGEIGVHSVKGHGSTFWFAVTLDRGPNESGAETASAEYHDIKILIVDDESNARSILKSYLSAWSMKNACASDSDTALNMLHRAAKENEAFDLALIDLVMPKVNGLQLGKSILEDKRLKDTRLILITAFDKPGTGEEAISLGFDAYLTKPVKQSQLLDSITTAVRKKRYMNAKSPEEIETGSQSHKIQLRKELILVAEDHPINQEVALLLLKTLGFEAHIANNGREALELLERIPYALVFMDCQMPELNGFETTRTIRKLETRTGRHIPIVAMTAHAIEGSREQCLSAGMDDYVSKPFNQQILKQMINKWILTSAAIENNQTGKHESSIEDRFDLDEAISMDVDAIKTKYGDYSERLIQLFLEDAPKMMSDINTACSVLELEQLIKATHSFNGICSTIGAATLKQICRELESCKADKNWKVFRVLVAHLNSEFKVVEKILLEAIAKKGK